MTKPVEHYLGSARQFDRLALLEPRIHVKQLFTTQADTCYRLAAKRARETNSPIPSIPVGPCLVPSQEDKGRAGYDWLRPRD